jgi:galactofuranosylgalactofuranosylrhamnosyl-N-acetylglucosaminyl-diphospho-decaprenol beta-1,5/1,6-galactofuranosyltransferase
VSWVGKDDSIDWQAYFHARNRIVAGLLHSSLPEGGTLLRHSQRMDLKHLMMMQYYPAALRNLALRDVLSGPDHMRKTLATRMPLARKIAKKYPETVVHKDPDEVLHSVKGRQVFGLRKRGDIGNPTGLTLRVFTAKSLLRHLLTKPAPRFVETPEVEFGKEDAEWWRVPHVDSALVSAADGSGKQIYVRDRETFRKMLFDSIRLHRRLKKQWPRLAREYREALPSLVAENEWMTDFEAKA